MFRRTEVVIDPWGILADEIIAREAAVSRSSTLPQEVLETPQQRKRETIILAAGALVMLAAGAVAVKGLINSDTGLAVSGMLVASGVGAISGAALLVNNFRQTIDTSRRFWLDS